MKIRIYVIKEIERDRESDVKTVYKRLQLIVYYNK